MADGKIEFGGEAWLNALREGLVALVQNVGAALDGASVKILEIVTDVPADLADPTRPDRSRAWHIVIEGRSAYANWGEIADADFGSVSDYNAILTLARWVYADDEGDRRAVEAHRSELIRNGLFRELGQRPEMSPALGAALRELHNGLARITA